MPSHDVRSLPTTPEELASHVRSMQLVVGSSVPATVDEAEMLLERAMLWDDLSGEAWARLHLGTMRLRSNALAVAATELLQARVLFQRAGSEEGAMFVLYRLGSVCAQMGDHENTRLFLTEGIAMAEAQGHALLEGILLANLALSYGVEGRAQPYRELTERAIGLLRAAGDTIRVAHGLCNLGGALARLGELDAAEDAYAEAAAYDDPAQRPLVHALIEAGRGELLFLRGDVEGGLAQTTAAREFLDARGLHYDALRKEDLALIGLRLNREWSRAIPRYEAAVEACRERGYGALRVAFLRALAECLMNVGQAERAYRILEEAWVLRTQLEREESTRRFAVLREGYDGSAAIRERMHARELAVRNQRLREALSDRERLNDELRHAAMTDPLTGLWNRRGLVVETERIEATALPWVAVLIDINEFKEINDVWGHARGDDVLVAVARCLASIAGDAGVAARLGGDEFGLVMPCEERPLATLVSDVADAINALEVFAANRRIRFSAAVGAARFRPGDDVHAALQSADAGMYVEKRRSRPERALGGS